MFSSIYSNNIIMNTHIAEIDGNFNIIYIALYMKHISVLAKEAIWNAALWFLTTWLSSLYPSFSRPISDFHWILTRLYEF